MRDYYSFLVKAPFARRKFPLGVANLSVTTHRRPVRGIFQRPSQGQTREGNETIKRSSSTGLNASRMTRAFPVLATPRFLFPVSFPFSWCFSLETNSRDAKRVGRNASVEEKGRAMCNGGTTGEKAAPNAKRDFLASRSGD